MKKKFLGLFIAAAMICHICAPVYAIDTKEMAAKRIKDAYIELCDSMGPQASEDEIFAAFLAQNPSLEVVSSSETYFNDNGEPVLPTRCTESNVNMTKDSYVYDRDYDAYIYFGYWEWNIACLHTKSVDDLVAYATSKPNEVQFRNTSACIYGYDSNGRRMAVYDPDNNNVSKISRAVLSTGDQYGAAYYINDILVRKGRIMVPFDLLNNNGTAVLTTQYLHTWSETTVTGGAASIGFSLDGINVELSATWSSSIQSWRTAIRSPGVTPK